MTDFGVADYFVGAMKGAILWVSPGAQVVDITHEIPPQDIEAGAFTLLAVYRDFPAETVHVAVVDPGVGSSRRPLLVAGGGRFFVGPDNGIFGHIYEREADCRVYHLDRQEFFRQPVSSTFHGRDVFAPVAGALSNGIKPAALGREVADYVRLLPLAARRSADGSLDARVIHIDRFGNCVTNLARDPLTEEMIESGARLILGEHEIKSFHSFYAEPGTLPGDVFAIWGSAGFLEVVALNSSAARLLNARRGQSVSLVKACNDDDA
ncbi:MAG TPA: SAM-dependent chlorinase/fluorinase [Pyrinomonadaceae bacterium]|nr:SAM-dependent chlorinase/fluorinase [Pyrinomonadaceae bacterium]